MTLDFFNINLNVMYNHIFSLPPSLHLHENSFQLLSSVNRIEEEFRLETAQIQVTVILILLAHVRVLRVHTAQLSTSGNSVQYVSERHRRNPVHQK